VDASIPSSEREIDKPVCGFGLEDVFSITGRAPWPTGRIERWATARSRQTRSRSSASRTPAKTTVTGVEMFRKQLEEGMAGDNAGLLPARASQKEDIERGMRAGESPTPSRPHTKFEGEVYACSKREGGRQHPSLLGSRPQFYIPAPPT